MANEKIDFSDLAEAITAGIAAGQPKRAITYNEYVNLPGKREPVLRQKVTQHGHPLQIKGCSQDTINHLNNLKPGRYIGGRVTVTQTGSDADPTLDIDYPWASANDRMENAGLFSSFSDLVRKIAREQQRKNEI